MLDLKSASYLTQDSLIGPHSNQEGANIAPLCALSKSEAHLAVTLNNGFISVCEGEVFTGLHSGG